MMLSCRKATELIEKRGLAGLNIIEKMQLTVHKSMCDTCKLYDIQSTKIDSILKDEFEKESLHFTESNNTELKEKIINDIDKKLKY